MKLLLNGVLIGEVTDQAHLVIEVADGGETVGPCSITFIGGGPLVIKGRQGIQGGAGVCLNYTNARAPLPPGPHWGLDGKPSTGDDTGNVAIMIVGAEEFVRLADG